MNKTGRFNLIIALLLILGALTAASLEQVNTTSVQTLFNKTLMGPTFGGTAAGSLSGVTLNSPVLSGTATLSGGQIAFPASQNESPDANTLDDYEEGTCMLSLGGTATYTSRTCNYTKIGRAVTLHFNMVVNSIGTGSASTITYSAGPPAVETGGYGVGPCLWSSGAVSPAQVNAYASPGTSTIIMRGNTAAAAADGALNLFSNSTSVTCSLTYMSS